MTSAVTHGARLVVAGAAAGLIGIGLVGLRATMRLLTITSGGAGRLTEGGNRAGDFTLDGTVFLVLAGTFLGVVIALLYGPIRRGLPKNVWLSALLTAPLLARVVMLHPDNIDFARFGPVWVAVLGFTFGCFVYTLILEATLRWLEPRWRLPIWANLFIVAPAVALLVLPVLVGTFGLDPLRLILYGVVAGLLIAWWRGAGWLRHLPPVLAIMWIAGGTVWWLRTVAELA